MNMFISYEYAYNARVYRTAQDQRLHNSQLLRLFIGMRQNFAHELPEEDLRP